MRKLLTVVLVVVAFAVAASAGDEKADALKLIDQGKKALEADKGQEAIDCLQKAIGLIQKSMATGFAKFLPKAWEGWEAGEPDSTSGSWGSGEEAFQWTQIERDYRRKSDNLDVEISITSQPQMVAGMRAALQQMSNPMMRKMLEEDENSTVEFIEKDGWIGWLKTEKDKSAECIAVHEKISVQIRFQKDDIALLKKFWEGIDRKGLADAMK